MKRAILAHAVLIAYLCTSAALVQAQTPDLALTHVHVVDVERGRVLPEQTVLIVGNRIAAVGPAAGVHVPDGAQVVEARGRYLIPGLWDMHAHTVDDRMTRETYLPLYLANGITGIRNMHADCFDPCQDDRTTLAEVRQWQREIAAGQLIGPRMVAASDVIQGPPAGEPSSVEQPTTEAQARALVGLLKERGVDLLKTYDKLPREAYFALADEARKQGIPFAGHVPTAVRASEASDAGQRSMEHLVGVFEECSMREDELRPRLVAQFGTPGFGDLVLAMAESFDVAKCERLYDRFARNRTWQVPNLLVWETRERIGDELWQDHPHLRYMPAPEREYWGWRLRHEAEFWTGGLKTLEPMNRLFRKMVGAMAHAGVGILAGSDAGMPFVFPGFGLHDELELLVEAGLTPAEALRAATLSAAEYLEATDSLGTVTPGRLADLVLLDANPLDDIRNTRRIRAVVFDGRYFDRPALDGLLAAVEEAASRSTVHVAPPTGEREADRASILAALERVRPGGTVQFAPGTYLMGGEIIRLTVPQVTLLGYSEGTTLRGCGPEEMARELSPLVLGERCNLLELAGARQTVRNLTFEHAFWALHVGCCWEGFPFMERGEGGHLIEGNTFRSNSNAVRVHGSWTEPSIIRNNRLHNNWHSVAIYGNTVHLLDNDISALEPEEVPGFEFPWDAVGIGPSFPVKGSTEITPGSCANNVVARNRIEGNADGIMIDTFGPGESCRNNVVRDNTIIVSRVRPPSRLVEEWGLSEPTFIGTPIALLNYAEAFGRGGFTWTGEEWSRSAESEGNDAAEESFIEGNVIEGNRIIGAEGLGMEILYASGNRIANNTFTAISPREPFPGNFFGPRPEIGVPLEWGGANGSGIWVSPGSDWNEISDNTFEEIASWPVVLEGDSNSVQMLNGAEEVRDIGTGNRVTATNQTYESKFIEAGGVRLHYLDFGGEGLPLIFIHSESWNAFTYKDFGAQFSDRYRVLAVTRPGYGQSEFREEGFSVPGQAESLLAFMDALEIERAVFAGNSSPTAYITYLAEHHPERVAGVIYLSGLNLVRTDRRGYPFEAEEIAMRALGTDSLMVERTHMLDAYHPEFMLDENSEIRVPALAFAARTGRLGWEELSFSLLLVGSPLLSEYIDDPPDSPFIHHVRRLAADEEFRFQQLEKIEDSLARAFLIDFADDPARQDKVQKYHNDIVLPARIAGRERFQQALGENLRLARLDRSAIEGYEYRDSPELIVNHIRDFLEEVERLEHER